MDKCLFISKSALEYNLDYYLKKTNKAIIGVVKNNAYGQGVKEIVSIIDSKVKMFAVSKLEEAIEVRKYTSKDILILDKIEDYHNLDDGFILTIISKKHLRELIRLDLKLRVHLKVDVGLKRKGISKEELDECLELIKNSKLVLEGIYTHYSSYKRKILEKEFNKFKIILDGMDTTNMLVHASSSVSSMVLNENVTNAFRLGVGMYGLKKLVKEMEPLKIVCELKCASKNIYSLKCFEHFGYDDLYVGKKGYIVVTNLGYGDGIFYKEKIKGYCEGNVIKEIGTRNMDNSFFYSPNFIMEESEIEIFGYNIKIDDFSKKSGIAVCRILALMNQNIEKKIID